MEKVRLLVIPPDYYGVGKYRFIEPYKNILKNYDNYEITITDNVPNIDIFFENFDAVIFNNFIHKELEHEANVERIKKLKQKGIKIIVDIDDYWMVDKNHPSYHNIIKNKVHLKKIELLKLADYIHTTTKEFAKVIKETLGLSKNVYVFSNAIDPTDPQFIPKPTYSKFIRFGWAGGSTHLADLQIVQESINQSISNLPHSKFVLCGFDTRGQVTEYDKFGNGTTRPIRPQESIWVKYEEIFTANYKSTSLEFKKFLDKFSNEQFDDSDERYKRVWTKDITEYGTSYNEFDVVLAPLVNSKFNQCKSQLKVIEAGFMKKPIIASESSPYMLDIIQGRDNVLESNSYLIPERKNHKDWFKKMKMFHDNPSMIKEIGEKLYETVKDKYDLNNVNKLRDKFYKECIM